MEFNISELIETLKTDNSMKDELVKGLDLKLARELPDDSTLKDITDDKVLKEYITSLRDENSKKNEKFKSEKDVILTELETYKQKEKERQNAEKESGEKSLIEQKKYNELIESLQKERDELRSKYESTDSILLTYKQKEENEKNHLLSLLPETDRDIFKNLDVEQLKALLGRINKNVSSPITKEVPNKNMQPKKLSDFEGWTSLELDKWIEENPALYAQLCQQDYK